MENTGKELICGEGLCVGTRCFSGGSIKNVPVKQETWVRYQETRVRYQETRVRSQETLGWEDPLKKGMATNSNILAWRNSMDKEAWWAIVHEISKSWTRLSD